MKLIISSSEGWTASFARMVDNLLATDTAYLLLGLAAATATVFVFIGLYLEYEPHELRVFGLAKTRKLTFAKDFPVTKLHRPPRKQVGSALVVAGVALEGLFGLAILRSGALRDARNDLTIARLQKATADANAATEAEKQSRLGYEKRYGFRHFTDVQRVELIKYWHKYAGTKVKMRGLWTDPEINAFGFELGDVLKKAGLVVEPDLNPPITRAAGIIVEGPWTEYSTITDLVHSLNCAGIWAMDEESCTGGLPICPGISTLGLPKTPVSCDIEFNIIPRWVSNTDKLPDSLVALSCRQGWRPQVATCAP